MSVGNLRSRADYERKINDHRAMLALQARMNRKYDRASATIKNELVAELELPQGNVEAELGDQNILRQEAFDDVSTLMPPTYARMFVDTYLKELTELQNFTTEFPPFKEKLKGRRRLLPATLWKQWLRYKRGSSMTRISGGKLIPTSQPTSIDPDEYL